LPLLSRRVKRIAPLACALLMCVLAWGARTAVVGDHRLHPDEALYGHWGLLILSGRDPWLTSVPMYKPPLLPYITFGSLWLLGCDPFAPFQQGPSELAVRLPGLVAGMATVVLSGRLVARLYRDRLAALATTAIVALAPFAILFSATGFTDPVMVALGLAACVAAAEGMPGRSGALAGLALATKQTGAAWLPLVGALLIITEARRRRPRRLGGVLARCALGFLVVVALALAWDWMRTAQGAESFWGMGVTGYGGLRRIWPTELAPRLRAWLTWLGYLLGSAPLHAVLVGGAAALVARAVRRRDWDALLDLTLIAFCIGYVLVHWLWAFPVWDRYLLPLVPLAAALLGRTLSVAARWTAKWRTVARIAPALMLVALIAGLAVPATRSLAGQVPVGAGLASYDGMEQVTAFLAGLPEGTVLYHHWLGWEYSFYLFNAPLYLAYWPDPAWLAQDVLAFGEAEPRYISLPAWEPSARIEAALQEVGYRLEPVSQARDADGEVTFGVYQIARFAENP
jgi:4-amino-4-deoxy-L-arabinose transferase-like glycosyltransferase